jgi:hypothetical protein
LQAVSKLSGKVVQENLLDPSVQGLMRTIIRDTSEGTFWLCTDRALFQVRDTVEIRCFGVKEVYKTKSFRCRNSGTCLYGPDVCG